MGHEKSSAFTNKSKGIFPVVFQLCAVVTLIKEKDSQFPSKMEMLQQPVNSTCTFMLCDLLLYPSVLWWKHNFETFASVCCMFLVYELQCIQDVASGLSQVYRGHELGAFEISFCFSTLQE